MTVSTRRAVLPSVALCLLVAGSVHAQNAQWPLYRNEQAGFELRYPPAFVVGAFKNTLPPDVARTLREAGGRVPFEHALVLVESARAGSRDRTALPVGEVTAISIEPQGAAEAAARRDLGRQIYGTAIIEVPIGAHRVQKFPGFPGPYGTAAFYYLVPLRDGAVLEFTAQRVFLEPPMGETGYDRVIERIIRTLSLAPPQR